MKNFFALVALSICAFALSPQLIAGLPAGPSTVLKNQFGETSINVITGGSNQIDCNFIVDSTNGNGLGVRSLKGSGCAHVYMHTSATAAAGNPNPAAGYILVQLANNYSGYIGGYSGFVSPVSGSNVNISSGLTQFNPYVITSVGTSTAANWQAVGLPAGLTPTVGQSFIATTSSAGTGTGVVQAPLSTGSNTLYIDVIGDANQSVSATSGANILMRVMGGSIPIALPSPSPTPLPLAATAPANNTVIGLRFVMLPLASQLH